MDQKLIQEESGSYQSTDIASSNVNVGSTLNLPSNFKSTADNLHTIYSNCKSLDRSSKYIGTIKDNIKLRNDLQSTLLNTKTLIDYTKTEVYDLVFSSRKQDKTLKLQADKLQNSFIDAVQIFSGIQNVLIIKLKRKLPSEPYPITHSEYKSVDYIYGDEEELHSTQQRFQNTLKEDLEEIIDREDNLFRLENDVKDINEIMRDLGTMVHAHGDTMNLIENEVEEVYGDVESGRQELEKAAEYMQKRRKKVLLLFIFLVVAVLVFSLILYYILKQ